MYRCGTEYRTPLTLGAAAPTVCESVATQTRYLDPIRRSRLVSSRAVQRRLLHMLQPSDRIRLQSKQLKVSRSGGVVRSLAVLVRSRGVERSRGLQPCARPDRDAWARAGCVCVSRRAPRAGVETLNLLPRPSPPLAPAPHVPWPFGRSARRSVPMGEALSTALTPWAVCSRGSVRSAGAGGCHRGRGRRRAPNRRPLRDPQRSRACRAMAPWRRRLAAAR
jgi:hypothetical protein